MHLAALGNYLICFSLFSGLISFVFGLRSAFFAQIISTVLTSVTLLVAFVISDFSVQNVVFYSSTIKPLIYKIAGLWTNSDSSLLFLVSLMALISCMSDMFEKDQLIRKISSRIYSIILLMIMSYIYFLANPFGIVPNIPPEGFGLNPVLQDEAVSIHPPFLYMGYVCYMVPFAYSLSMLIMRNAKFEYIHHIFWFSKIGLGALSAGIALGSWWAYRELGWGGFWFFDPVENISLLPWLLGLALHHSIILTVKKRAMFKSSILLSSVNFLVIVAGVIMVRSGGLVSVHSFASNTKSGIYIIGAFIILSAIVFILQWLGIKALEQSLKGYNSKPVKERFAEKITKYGILSFYLAAFSISLGVIYPLIFKIFSGISINLDSGYFCVTFVPLGILIAILSFYSLFVDKKSFRLKYTLPALDKKVAMNISHLGVVLMVAAIILNAIYSRNMEFVGKVGDRSDFSENTSVTLQNIRYAKGPNYYRQIAEFWVDIDGKITVLKPENRYYDIEEAISAESDIYSSLTRDVYAVIGNVDKNNQLYANIYIRPYMAFVWFGMFLISLGVFVSLLRKK